MELRDIKTIKDVQEQVARYGIMVEQVADNLQGLKKIDLLKGKQTPLDDAQALLYRASRLLAEMKEE